MRVSPFTTRTGILGASGSFLLTIMRRSVREAIEALSDGGRNLQTAPGRCACRRFPRDWRRGETDKSMRDGKLVVEAPEAALAAGHQAKVPVMIGANDRDLGAGSAESKEVLFARFGASAATARKLYDPGGDQTLDELQQQAFADMTLMVSPPIRAAFLVAESQRAS
jgi:hypothetical protein